MSLLHKPLRADAMYPAGVAGVDVVFVDLPTGVRLRVATAGPRDGRPVFLLHGWGASLYMWRHALALLPAYGLRCFAMDQRGYGLSDKPGARGSYTLDAYSADLSALAAALDVHEYSLIGQSMGGGLALRHAQRHPSAVSKIVLINPTGLSPVRAFQVLGALPTRWLELLGRRAMPRWVIGVVLRRLAYGDPSLATERDVDEYWAPTQLDGQFHAARAAIDEFDWSPLKPAELSTFPVPSLVMLGRKDRLLHGARRALQQLRGARVVELDGGHAVNEEHPEAAYRAAGDFLANSLHLS